MKNADLPAMPNPVDTIYDTIHNDSAGYGKASIGLTKREMFAMNAMQAMLSSRHVNDFNASDADFNNELFSKAVGYADALLKELEK
jgi:hypothetical protein